MPGKAHDKESKFGVRRDKFSFAERCGSGGDIPGCYRSDSTHRKSGSLSNWFMEGRGC